MFTTIDGNRYPCLLTTKGLRVRLEDALAFQYALALPQPKLVDVDGRAALVESVEVEDASSGEALVRIRWASPPPEPFGRLPR